MKKNTLLLLIASASILVGISAFKPKEGKPKISFSFDDGRTRSYPDHKYRDWNNQLLSSLKKHDVKCIFFVMGQGMNSKRGKEIMTTWDEANHLIGNHTYTHPNLNNEKVTLERFKNELLRNDSLINGYNNYTKLFRFPYLKEGNTKEKRDGFRKFLKQQGYKIGHVTIDASDWYVDSRLVKRLKKDPKADISGFKKYYIDHLYEKALYYDSLSTTLTGRKINHNLLLHHNLSAGLFMDDLIQHFKDKGWEIIDADTAYQDKIYKRSAKTLPAGESLIWAMTSLSNKYKHLLRYPAEDSKYEKDKMDKLGL